MRVVYVEMENALVIAIFLRMLAKARGQVLFLAN